MIENTDPFNENSDSQEAKIIPPDYTLKKMIGEDINIKEVFSEEVIEKAQQSIDKHQDTFLEWVAKDIELLEEHYAKATANPSACEAEIVGIEEIAARLKSQAGTFKYGLATLVAKSLGHFCNVHPSPHKDHLVVIRKHIDTLSVIFNKKIIDDGGAIGKELLDNLSKLVEKYN